MSAPTEPKSAPLVGRTGAAINVVSLGLLGYGVLSATDIDRHGGYRVAVPLLAVAVAAWLVWLASRVDGRFERVGWPSLSVMAAAGGALAGVSPLALVFPAVAAMGITIWQPVRRALPIVVLGPAVMAISVPVSGRPWGVILGGLSAVLGGTVLGISRRDIQIRSSERAATEVAEARADAEAARAELLAGRNHLARELHDVLAHTLSALSLQLEALTAILPDPEPAVAAQMADIRRLVRDGLDEARGAVAALREDLPPLDERLAKLAAERRAGMEVTGRPRDLPPDVALALYRVAQEALTNAAKHAPGTRACVHLDFSDKELTLSVANPPAASNPAPPETGGGGYGLQGIRERMLLLGGSVAAGPDGGGWRVEAKVPA